MKRIFLALLTSLGICSTSAFAVDCIPSGVTDQYTYFVAVDATDFTTRETGLSSFTVRRSRNGAASAAFTTPTVNETDVTNMPGVYELLLDEDMTIDAGDDVQHMALHITHAGMAPVTKEICISRPKITAGETLTVSSGVGQADPQAATISSGDFATGAITETTFATTAGSFDALGIIDQGTAQAATGTTLQLRSAASFADDEIIGATCLITGGSAGVGQARTVTDYVSSTDTATVSTWTTTPTGTITYECFGTASVSGGGGASAADVWSYGTRSLTALDEDSTTIDLDASTIGTATTVGTVNALAANSLTAAAAAADLGTELGTATWASTTRSLTILDEDSTTLDLNATPVGSITTVTNILTGLRDTVIEDMGSVTWGCAMAALLAGVAGDLDVTGTSGIYEDPSGTETRITYTVSGADRTTTITCPTY